MIINIERVPQESAAVVDPMIPEFALGLVRAGPKGLTGNKGWSASLAVVEDGERRVHQISGWLGGEGAAPAAGQYLGAAGLVTDIEDAIDIRGGVGETGVHTTGAAVNGSYHLIITLSDGATIDAGYVRGATGAAATVSVGTVTTLAAGQPATVTNIGTTSAAVFDFGIPEGAAGPGGTVTSVGVTVPTGLQVTPSSITTSGVFAFAWGSGYQGYTIAEANKLAAIEALADVTNAAKVGSTINGVMAKATPIDADAFAMLDSAASDVLKKTLWSSIKATLKTYFDGLYQPIAAKLTTLAGQTWAADSYTYYTSSSAATIGTITSFGRSVAAAVDGPAVRTLLGLGSLATASTINNGNWSGTDLSVPNGGTGLSTLTANNVILGNGASSPSFVAPGAAGNVLQSNGTTWVSGGTLSGPYSVASVSNIANVAAVDLSIDGTKEQAIFEFQDVVPASDGAHLQVLLSTDNGSTYAVSITSLLHRISTTTVNSGGSTASTTGASLIESVGSDTSEYGITGRFAFSQLSGERAIITGSGHYINNAGALVPFWAVAQAQVTTAVTNVRWKFSTGNLESGRIITINMEAV